MKRLSAVFLAVVFCFSLVALPLLADPGDETTTAPDSSTATSTDYPPPPEGWVGPWPPPDWDPLLDGGGPSPPTPDGGDGGDDTGWDVPEE